MGWADLPEPRKGSWLGDTMYGARVVLCACVHVSVPLR